MVAVTLSPEVRPLPMMDMQMQMQPLLHVAAGGGGGTGMGSVDDHIARLKANARQHVEREMQGHAQKEANGGGDHQQDAAVTSPRGQKNPYLPPPEVAKTIACRFFPNCNYGEQCIFWHPPSHAPANGGGASASSPSTSSGEGGPTPAVPVFGGENGQANGDNASSSSPSAAVNGNGHTLNGLAYHSAAANQYDSAAAMMYPGMQYDMAAAYGQVPGSALGASVNGQPVMYYVPAGYDAAAAATAAGGMAPEGFMTMGYGGSAPYAPHHTHSGSHSSQSHSTSNGYGNGQQSQQQQQQQPNGAANGNLSPYYGFVPYGPHGGYGYPGPVPGYAQHPYYPASQSPLSQQAGLAYPGASYANGSPLVDEQAQAHLNGLNSPASAASSAAIADPAIISQGPESQAQIQTSKNAAAHPGVNASATDQETYAAQMEKSGSNQSNKSGKSASGKKAAKKAGTAGAASGQLASPSIGGSEQAAEFVLMAYYPGMPAELMSMIPPQFQPMPAQYAYPGMQQQLQPPLSQAALEAEFAKVSLANGVAPSASVAAVPAGEKGQPQSQEGAAKRGGSNGAVNGHQRTPSGTMHTFFQTSGEGVAVPSTAATPATALLAASTSGARAPANGRPVQAAVNGSGNGHLSRRSGDFQPAPSVSGGSSQPGKRFPPYTGTGNSASINRAGPSSNSSTFTRNGYSAPGPRPPFDPSKPLPNCRYFDMRSCRHGDLCHFVHFLHEERPLPSSASTGADVAGDIKPTMTRDARLLGLNIGGPDGTLSEKHPRHPAEYRRPGVGGPGISGTQSQQQQQNGQHFSPQGYPHAVSKGRFVHSPHPSSSGFAAQQQQQQKQQEIARLTNSGDSADAQEKIQRLISETRNLPTSTASTAARSAAAIAPTSIPRSNPIPASLGRRPPPAQRGHGLSSAQRVPSGENDFPALSAGAMERSVSNTSDSKRERETSAQADGSAAPVQDAPVSISNSAREQQRVGHSATGEAAIPDKAAATAVQPAPAAASKSPVFSWASAAAKAASLPTPPAPKRAPSKPRGSAASTKETTTKSEKLSKAEKIEKADKDDRSSVPLPSSEKKGNAPTLADSPLVEQE